MFKRSKVCTGVLVALGGAMLVPPAVAQSGERVEITGSAIRRIVAEGALPVQVLSSQDIARSGATSVSELIQKLPAMQGFTVTTTAVGTNSGGRVTASIHDIGEAYTLVLLNGRRLAPSGSGSTVNLNSIPMSAIERVEILTDGASALYGSDAIAGVVNFILKSNYTGGALEARYDKPLEGGGDSWNASITYGFGDLTTDRFNVLVSYRRDEQKKLLATDRDFAKSAFVRFDHDGKNYLWNRGAPHAIPANPVVVLTADPSNPITFNAYERANGQCAPNHLLLASDGYCYFDFASTLEIYPESTRDSIFASGRFMLGQSAQLFAEAAYSKYDLTAVIAANAVNMTVFGVGSTLPANVQNNLFNTYIQPNIGANTAADVRSVTAQYRVLDLGGRTSNTITDSTHVVLGGSSEFGAWEGSGALTFSKNSVDERYAGGYTVAAPTNALLRSGELNPFLLVGQQSAATQQGLRDATFYGSIRTESTELKGVDVRASGPVFRLPAGEAMLAVGADHRQYHYRQVPTAAGGTAGYLFAFAPIPAFDMERSASGAFAEMLVPVMKGLELTGALRYDKFDSIRNNVIGQSVGQGADATTYKVSLRYQPTREVLVRGSVGTGFKAPSMLDIGRPLTPAGVTGQSYNCPFPNTQFCRPGRAQYQVLSGGNSDLRPEKSEQYTIGVRFEPTGMFSAGLDLWSVEIKDAVSAVSQAQAFGDPQKYRSLFTTYVDPGDQQTYYAFRNAPLNIGRVDNLGIDWDVTGRFTLPVGSLTASLNGTYLIRSRYTLPGTDDVWETSLGRTGTNLAVSFRNIVRAGLTLRTGAFSNLLAANYRSGYADFIPTGTTRPINTATGQFETVVRQVPAYTTFDWQGTWDVNKSLTLRAGIKNLLNKEPPLSLRTGTSHHVGWDPRYTDTLLRTAYLQGTFNF